MRHGESLKRNQITSKEKKMTFKGRTRNKTFRAFCENDKAYKELKAMGLLEAVKHTRDAMYFGGKLAFADNIYVKGYAAHVRGEAPINIHLLKDWASFAGKNANIDAIVDYWTSYDGDKSEEHKAALKEFLLKPEA